MDLEIKNKILEWKYILPFVKLEIGRGEIGKFSFMVGTSDCLTFELRTKENGHNIPHVHVSTKIASLSIAIETGEILAQSGAISGRKIKDAQNWIFQNQDFLKAKWDKMVDCPIKFSI